MSFTLAAWGAFLRPAFDDVLADAGILIIPVDGKDSPVDVAPNCDALYVRLPQYASEEIIGALPNLKVLAVPGAGVEVIDIEGATKHGVPVLSGRGMGHEAVADWTLASILWLTRHVGEMHTAMSTGDWPKRFDIHPRRDVHKLAIGIIGYGAIGARFATILTTGFGSEVLVYDTAEGARTAAENAGYRVVDLDTLLRESDIVSIHAQAKHGEPPMIAARELALMKPTGLLVNTARGALLDYPSILDALANEKLAGAALDVFDQEPPQQELIDKLTAFGNVLVSPHQAGMTIDATDSLAYGVATSVVEVLNGGRPSNCANPEVWADAQVRA
jgi:D-3-phosphoglycerate dehydrogenase / 2-oxoglutarate reductase